MDTKNLPIAVVGIAVSILIVASILVPVVAESQSEDSITNTLTASGTYKLDGVDDYSFKTNPLYAKFEINNNSVDITNWYGASLIVTDKCRVDRAGHYFQLFDSSGLRSSNINTELKNIAISYVASTKTFTYTVYTDLTDATVENTYSYSVENIIYAIPNGDYGALNTGGDNDITYYVNDLSDVICGGAYTTGDLDTSYFCEGDTIYVGNSSYTGTVSVTTTSYADYTDVIKCNGFSITITDGESSETFTPYTVFVPLKVIGHTPNQNTINSLINVIPLIVIVGIVVATVGIIAYRRS